MTVPDNLLRKQISFGIAGIIFGVLLGFVVSHEVQGGRAARTGPAAPQAQSGSGMGGGARGV